MTYDRDIPTIELLSILIQRFGIGDSGVIKTEYAEPPMEVLIPIDADHTVTMRMSKDEHIQLLKLIYDGE